MKDIPLAKAQVIWTPSRGSNKPAVKVVGGDVPDDRSYASSWGACNSDFSSATEDEKLRMLLSEVVYLTVREGIAINDVHDAFMVIPEYREAMVESGLIRSPDA